MTSFSVALILGLFGTPAILMALGHRLRGRSLDHRRRFWGGVYGYFLGIVISISAMLLPPVAWVQEPSLRPFLVHWAMFLGGVIGILTGPYWARKPGRRR
jgi:hypothetical protein